jgi:outer membrane receptor protein involved in Fe transport
MKVFRKLISFFHLTLVANLSVQAATLIMTVSILGSIANAQDRLEEIIVLGTKSAEGTNVQEAPYSITALTGDYIEQTGIKDVFDLQQSIPGLIMGQSQTSTTSNFSIRGIGTSSNNFGLESSVGLYVDGVYRSRQSSMINDLVDISMVEVFRGPQGTLFGKNTPQGALQIITKKPTLSNPRTGGDRDAFVSATIGDYGLIKLSAASNLAISENTALRATVFSSQRDGYVTDVFSTKTWAGSAKRRGGDALNNRDRHGVRLQLYSEPSDQLNVRIIADYAEIDEACCVAVSRIDSLYSRASLSSPLGPTPGTDAALVQLGGTIFTNFNYPAPFLAPFGAGVRSNTPFEAYEVALNQAPRSGSEDHGLSVEINYDLGNDFELTSISAVRSFDTSDSIDADFTNVDLLTRTNMAQQSSFSQELRLARNFDNGINFVAGTYYFKQDLNNQKETNGRPLLGTYIGAINPALAQAAGGVNAISAATGGLIPAAGTAFPINSFAHDNMRQSHDSVAAFSQVDLPVNDNFTVTFGARYTGETKSMVGTFVQGAQGPPPNNDAFALVACSLDPTCIAATGISPFNPFDPATIATIIPYTIDGWGTYLFAPLAPRPDMNESLSDDHLTSTAKLTWRRNDTTMVYLSWGTGYKSGGTNTDRIAAAFNPVFQAETSKSVEWGIKKDFPNQNMRLNLAFYDTQIDNLQANSFTGTGFNLQNAGKADTSGSEIEFWWFPSDATTIQAFYARSNAEYESFNNGTCWDAYVFHTGKPDPGSTGSIADEVCNRTGGRLGYNPETRFFLALTKEFQLNSATSFIRAEYSYASEIMTDGDLDPFTLLDSFALFNARYGFRWGDDNSSELVLWGRNLGDERYYAGSFDAPVQPGRMNSYPAEPRTFGLTYRKQF